jgi:prepilin-type N-terminal cleavage/methylation domain-containing protein
MKTHRRGFSLFEMVCVLALLGLIGGIALGGRSSQQARSSSQALAMDLVSELRACRAQAMSSATPVAACFPGNGVPHSQSLYVMSGQAMGRIRRVRDWANDYPKAILAVGYWGSGATRPDQTEIRKKVEPRSWLASDFKDFALIFAPDGRVASNDLPLSDGTYKVLVCGAVDYSAETLGGPTVMDTPPPAYWLRRAATPYTVTIDPDGNISAESGAPGLTTIDAHPFPMASPPAPARTIPSFVAGAPAIDSVEVLPKPVIDPVATVVKGGNLNVTVRATDSSGDDLFVEWSSTLSHGLATGNGAFSSKGKQPMTWLPAEGKWITHITWTPPLDSEIGDRFELSCSVSNSAGTAINANSALLRDVTVRKDETVFLCDDSGIFSMQTNGTAMKQIVSAGDPWYVNVSPDGTKIVWDQNAWDRDAMYVANIDGSDQRFLTSAPSDYYLRCHWNPTGTKIYFAGSYRMLRSINPDGTGNAELMPRIPGVSSCASFKISSDGKYIAVVAHAERTVGDRSTASSDLWVGELDESVDPPRVKDWTNTTLALPKNTPGGSNHFLTMHPKPLPSTKPVVLVRAGLAGYYNVLMAEIEDHGAGATPRFTVVTSLLCDSLGRRVNFMDIAFSPDGDRACATEGSFGGATVYDWDLASKTVSNGKKISTRGFRWVDWR